MNVRRKSDRLSASVPRQTLSKRGRKTSEFCSTPAAKSRPYQTELSDIRNYVSFNFGVALHRKRHVMAFTKHVLLRLVHARALGRGLAGSL